MAERIVSLALYREVSDRLRQMIVRHRLVPGQRIDEHALAQEFGVSRTPLREALKVLQSEGLVRLEPRRGCYVAELSHGDTAEVFSVLRSLEADAARELAATVTPEQMSELEELHLRLERCVETGELQRYAGLNLRFHDMVQYFAGNSRRRGIVNELRQTLALSRRVALDRQSRMAGSIAEHRQFVAALRAGNGAESARIMIEHIESTCAGALAGFSTMVEPEEAKTRSVPVRRPRRKLA